MEVRHALSQISEIRSALLGTQIYRGHRPATVAGTGLIALACPLFLSKTGLLPHQAWLMVGVFCFLFVGAEMTHDYWYSFGTTQKRLARQVLGQFLPPLAVGAGVSMMWTQHPDLLPSLWACFYGLGLFAARLHLGHGVGWVALFYVIGGMSLLSGSGDTLGFAVMPYLFGIGQLFLALVLHWNLPRAEGKTL